MSVGGKMKKLEELRFVLTDEMNNIRRYYTKRTDGTRKRAQDFN